LLCLYLLPMPKLHPLPLVAVT
ncbi:MAG: hypothetical protein RLZZ401_536, partial [Pseudomonadota bacterium]